MATLHYRLKTFPLVTLVTIGALCARSVPSYRPKLAENPQYRRLECDILL